MKSLIALFTLTVAGAVSTAVPAAGEGVALEPPLATSGNVHVVAHIPGSAAGIRRR